MEHIMRYFFAFLVVVFSSEAFACSIEDPIKKSVYAVLRKDEDSNCSYITLNFPDDVPAGDSLIWSNEYVSLEVNGIYLNLDVFGSEKDGFRAVFFCLPKDIINKTIINIGYDSESTKNPPAVSFCRKTITIDNLANIIKPEK
jgi:hypothetical protein